LPCKARGLTLLEILAKRKQANLVFLKNRAFASKASCRLALLEKFVLFITENIKDKLNKVKY